MAWAMPLNEDEEPPPESLRLLSKNSYRTSPLQCALRFCPKNAPAATPGANPALAEPAAPLTLTVLRKPAPPMPPTSHCWAKAQRPDARSSNVFPIVFISFSRRRLVDHPHVEGGVDAAQRDHQRHAHALGD